LHGWRQLHRRLPRRFAAWRLIVFQSGVLALFFALASPLHELAERLLQFHMIQHLLLTMVVPPLLLLGAPTLPLLRGLPRPMLQHGLSRVLAAPALQRLGHFLTHPAHRGRHLGQAVARALIDQLQRRGVSTFMLGVSEDNSGARRLYEAVGFHDIAARENVFLASAGSATGSGGTMVEGSVPPS